jgi:hypothetical protein
MQQKLILAGCSWGCGEWLVDQNKTLNINHPGLSEYLSTHYDVINLSKGGSSNWQMCFAIRNYLTYVKTYDQFKIVLVQTDAYRPQGSEKYHVDFDQLYQQSTDLQNFYERNLEIFYIKLDSLAKEFQTKIYLVGGLNDLALDILSLYNNLVPMCESWVRLMDPAHLPSRIPLILDPDLFKDAKQHDRPDIMEQIATASDVNFLKAQQLMETDWFGPSFGDFHPSRKGHALLADHIKEYFTKELQ